MNSPICDQPWRDAVCNSLGALIARRRLQADADRHAEEESLAAEPAAHEVLRRQLRAMLGWPLDVTPRDEQPVLAASTVESLGHVVDWANVSRITFEVTEGFHSYALVCSPNTPTDSPRPLLVFQHGGEGTPAQVLNLQGDSSYHQAVRQAVERGWTVVLPQLLLWQKEFQPPIDQFAIDRDLKQLGGSRVALDLRTLQRAAEETAAHFPVQENCWAVAGLSYGGFYALLAGALDQRFRAVLSSCYVNDRYRYNWGDWIWFDSARHLDDVLLAQLIHPRPLWIEVGTRDEVFDVKTARPVLCSIVERRKAAGSGESLVCREFDGGHEFCPDGQGLDFLTLSILSR